jgi:lysozyme family protein
MTRFEECLAHVLQSEGKFVDDPLDPGGATNQGITQKVYDAWRTARSLPERSVADIEDAEVRAIYIERYWAAGRCGELPQPIDLIHFDAAVNHGVGTANRMLQTALGVGIIDGVVGKNTLAAAQTANPRITAGRYCNLRITRYIAIVAMHQEQAKFLGGWLHRVGQLLLLI